MAKRRSSPAKIEGEAREAGERARSAALNAGKSEEDAAAAAEQAAAAVRAGEEPPALEGDGDDGDEDEDEAELTVDEVTERMIPEAVATRIGEDVHHVLEQNERALLAEACYVFGINPDPTLKPRELAAYRYSPGEPNAATPIPASVTIVTAGGLKVRYPIDEDSESRLRMVYNCFKVDARTGERQVLPLPPDLTLPRSNVDGVVRNTEHQYRTGVLRESEADRAKRATRIEQLRRAGRIP